MKKIFIIILIIYLTQNMFGQDVNCEKYSNSSKSYYLCDDSTFFVILKKQHVLFIYWFDTLTYGKYIPYKNKYYFLYSHPSIMSNQLESILVDEHINKLDSGVTLIVNSPYSTIRKTDPIVDSAYFYTIEFSNKKGEKKIFPNIFFNDTITIYDIGLQFFDEIKILIYPYKNISMYSPSFANLEVRYTKKSIEANFISLNIPRFSPEYIYLLRFDSETLEVIDKCNIIINKKHGIFRDNCKGKKYNKLMNFIVFKKGNPYKSAQDCY